MNEPVKHVELTEEQIDKIAEKAVEKVFERIYEQVGKSVLKKLAWLLGVAIVSFALWLAGKGVLQP